MGKNIFFWMLVLSFLGVSCRNANDDAQKIDQRVQIYIDSVGQDMLNSKIMGSYQSIVLNDVYGDTDVATVPLTLKKNSDTTYYIEYLAGAKRKEMANSGITQNFQSKIALAMKKKIGDQVVTTQDTLELNYTMTPELFQISTARYNGIPVFTNNPDTENIINIFK